MSDSTSKIYRRIEDVLAMELYLSKTGWLKENDLFVDPTTGQTYTVEQAFVYQMEREGII